MSGESRNTVVVVALIIAMTAGARVLLWMEPREPRYDAAAALMAVNGGRVESVTIHYGVAPIDAPEYLYDCILSPGDGALRWDPQSPHVRVLVVGSGGARLDASEAQTLLAVLGSLRQNHGLDLHTVRLAPDSDDRIHPELPREATELRALLTLKGIIE